MSTSPLPQASRQLARILDDLASVREVIDGLEHEVTMLARVAGCTWEQNRREPGTPRSAARPPAPASDPRSVASAQRCRLA